MRSIQKVAWLSVVLAVSAVAQETEEAPATTEPKGWSLGVGSRFWALGSASSTGGGGLASLATVPRASLEFAVTPRWTLGLGVTGVYYERDAQAENGVVWIDRSVGAELNGRYFLNDGRARLSVRLSAMGQLGEGMRYDPMQGYLPNRFRTLAADAGFAVDLTLVEGLSLRAEVSVLSVGQRTETLLDAQRQPVLGISDQEALTARLGLEPLLELRLAF